MTRVSSGIGRLLVLAVVGFVIAACSGSSTKPPAGRPGTSSASGSVSPGAGTQGVLQSQVVLQIPGVRMDLLALDQVSDRVIIARLRAVNLGDQPFGFYSTLRETNSNRVVAGATDPNAVSAIALFDGANSRRYSPLVGTDGKCLCTRDFASLNVPARGSADIVAAFPTPPAGVASLDLLFPDAPPFLDVPVHRGGDAKISVDEESPAIDTAAVQTQPGRILPVYATSDGLGNVQSDDGSDLAIRLSADVLFALNKADLSPAAQDILRGVAAKIDQSTGSTVRIDGYTDNSGSDAINNPLSERRAQSVQAALRGLVTRSGVTYQPKGHGSADPVASNSNDEGRRLNRRVTVTFASPKAKTPAAPGSTAAVPSGATSTIVHASGKPLSYYTGDWPADPAKVSATIGSLRRDAHGFAVVTVTVRNDDPAVLDMGQILTATTAAPHWGYSTSGVTVTSGKVLYRPLYDAAGHCIGPNFDNLDPKYFNLGIGRQLTVTAMYKIPAETTSVNVDIPGFQTAKNVPVK